MSRLAINGVVKSYGGPPVLEGVEMVAAASSLTAVLGVSGCGKTTLLRVIAGFERAQAGVVTLGERTLDDGRTFVAPERRGIGYVPQEGALFPHLTVAANVGFGLPRRKRRGPAVTELLAMVGIEELARRMPGELSGGEQQRVALARALARRPQVLLLDEPFSSLDASLRGRVREEVHALLRAQGVTTVLVTHDQEEALSMADSVAVLREGRVVQQGTPTELYERPIDARLARFLGSVNLLPADFRDGEALTPLGALPLRAGVPHPTAGTGVVMVRPEQIDVRPRREGAAGAEPTAIEGMVEQCRYYGHDAVLAIRPSPQAGLELVLARVLGQHALGEGTEVSLAAHGAVTALP
jgi:iron(III) transport system ATP-binding protein